MDGGRLYRRTGAGLPEFLVPGHSDCGIDAAGKVQFHDLAMLVGRKDFGAGPLGDALGKL